MHFLISLKSYTTVLQMSVGHGLSFRSEQHHKIDLKELWNLGQIKYYSCNFKLQHEISKEAPIIEKQYYFQSVLH